MVGLPPRRERRQWARDLNAPWSDFRQPTPVARVLPPMYVWKGAPWEVEAHVYTDCAGFFREWAGVLGRSRQERVEKVRFTATSICIPCYIRWRQAGV